MKKTLRLLLLLLIPLAVKSQTTLTTYYIIPPTSGCNGVWAISSLSIGCGAGMTYMFQPNTPVWCGQMGAMVGDTQFIQLCSIPCDLFVSDFNGPCAICSTGTTTEIDSPVKRSPIVTTYPNPATTEQNWNFMLNASGYDLDVKIYNSCGQLVEEKKQENAPAIYSIGTSALVPGNYIVEIGLDGNAVYHEKLVLIR